jgi:hypothetical protein
MVFNGYKGCYLFDDINTISEELWQRNSSPLFKKLQKRKPKHFC